MHKFKKSGMWKHEISDTSAFFCEVLLVWWFDIDALDDFLI